MHEAVAGLPPLERDIVDCAYFGGMTVTEIGERLGVPPDTVKTSLRLALAKLAGDGR